MARICFVLLVIAAAVLFVDCKSPRRCSRNEQWTDCGTACPPTCEDPNPSICTEQCVIGCQCKPGYLRNANRRCVKESECFKS
ncbi:hypothetical protein KPH14_007292 [Odynerus spinipes]|uniref:TIL domain-containing protein n=1 Tax=Odynerus spinipes TaxID=1348599 RepID=A0AAD9VIK8_9HYME|nr:hypothetical protein KPH14_007292 [Odynerus spinipes]